MPQLERLKKHVRFVLLIVKDDEVIINDFPKPVVPVGGAAAAIKKAKSAALRKAEAELQILAKARSVGSGSGSGTIK